MRSTVAILLGATGALAQSFTNSSMPMPTGTPDDKAFPSTVGDFKFFGCLTGTFPGFAKVASDEKMTLDLCAASCPSQFMGVVGSDCFCANAVDSSASKKDDKSKCNLPCPGMPSQHCGGKPSKMRRADDVPAGSAVTAYERDAAAGATTVTSTHVSTITACPSTVTDCPVGSKTHSVVVETVPVCPAPKWHEKKIVCCGDHCAPEYPCDGKGCKNQRVVCEGDKCHTEDCSTNDWHKLVICKGDHCKFSQCQGDECNKKVVCYNGQCVVEKCYANECEKNMVCKGDKCGWSSCKPGDAHCKAQVNCNGDDCKVVKPTGGPATAPAPKPTNNGNNGNHGGCNGKDCIVVKPTEGGKPVGPTVVPVTGAAEKFGVSLAVAVFGLAAMA